MKVFISYSWQDSEFARKLSADLAAVGIETWVDVAELQPGQRWQLEIRKAIEDANYMLVLIYSHSAVSGYIMKEIDMALGKPDLPAIPVVIDEDGKSLIPPNLADIQWDTVSHGFFRRELLRAGRTLLVCGVGLVGYRITRVE